VARSCFLRRHWASPEATSLTSSGDDGSAVFTAQTVIEEAGPDERCTPLFGADLSTTIVLTYKDHSMLSLVTGPGSFFCTDGSVFIVDFGGTAESHPSARVTAEVSVDLD
jgi:hypothetical protein